MSKNAKIDNSMVAEGCNIKGTVENSIVFTGCTIEEDAVVKDSVVMPNTTIHGGAKVEYSIIGECADIGKDAVIGKDPLYCINSEEWGISVVGSGKKIADGRVIKEKEIV